MRKHASRLASFASALVLASGLLFAGVQAQALEPRPPDAILKQGDRTLQDGRLIASCWTRGCIDYFEDRYPAAIVFEPGAQLRIRLTENKRPRQFSLESSQSRDGSSRRIDTTLRRVVQDGRTVAWDAYFRLESPDRHYYMDAFGIWRDDGGRELGDSYWQFHAKTGP